MSPDGTELTEEAMRAAVLRAHPDLAGAPISLAAGWHSIALDVGDRLIFKFPRHDLARRALLREAALLPVIRRSVAMPVPDMRLHEGPPLFSEHRKIEGGHLLASDYGALGEEARQRLGRDLGRFYAELHALAADG